MLGATLLAVAAALSPARVPVPGPQDPPPAAAPQGPVPDAVRLPRLAELAARLQDAAQDPVPLATEAVRLCGFVIWDEDRKVLAEPLGAPRLCLAITDAELRDYTSMLRAGQRVQRDDLIAAVDALWHGLGATTPVAPFVMEWLRKGTDTGNPSARALAVLLQCLGNARGGAAAQLDGAEDAELDPLQALLMLRVLTEDLGVPLRRAMARGEIAAPAGGDGKEAPRGPAAAPALPRAVFAEAPGWAEDAYAGGITGLFGAAVEGLGSWGKSLSNGLGKANALATICKFVATYTFLRGEVKVEEPGQPLIRTKDGDPGEQRTLTARFWIDGTRVTDWMKDHRQVVALAGLDIDMPKTGALKGIETEWDITQDRFSSKYHLIQTVRGQPDISKIKTDDAGLAHIRVEGCPQPRPLDPKKVMSLEKRVDMVVTPQVKSTEMQQDLVDAVTGAIGLKDGPAGLLTPVIETLYRLKWKGGVPFTLRVRDWQPAETLGQAEITLRANGHRYTKTSAHQMSLDRSLKFTDVEMQVTGVEKPPMPDPEVLKNLPATMREQIEAGMKQMAELAKKRAFHNHGAGQVELHLHDREFGRGEGDGCVDETEEDTTTWDCDKVLDLADRESVMSMPQFFVDCDLEKLTAKVVLDMHAQARVVHVNRARHRPETRTETNETATIFSGLKLLPPYDQGIVIPLQKTEIREMDAENYYGAVTIGFLFGPGDRYTGNAILSYSVTRKVPPPKETKGKRR